MREVVAVVLAGAVAVCVRGRAGAVAAGTASSSPAWSGSSEIPTDWLLRLATAIVMPTASAMPSSARPAIESMRFIVSSRYAPAILPPSRLCRVFAEVFRAV